MKTFNRRKRNSYIERKEQMRRDELASIFGTSLTEPDVNTNRLLYKLIFDVIAVLCFTVTALILFLVATMDVWMELFR